MFERSCCYILRALEGFLPVSSSGEGSATPAELVEVVLMAAWRSEERGSAASLVASSLAEARLAVAGIGEHGARQAFRRG